MLDVIVLAIFLVFGVAVLRRSSKRIDEGVLPTRWLLVLVGVTAATPDIAINAGAVSKTAGTVSMAILSVLVFIIGGMIVDSKAMRNAECERARLFD